MALDMVTGVGGGSLMMPILVLIVDIALQTAIGTDLLVAAAAMVFKERLHAYGRHFAWLCRSVSRPCCGR